MMWLVGILIAGGLLSSQSWWVQECEVLGGRLLGMVRARRCPGIEEVSDLLL